MHMVEWRRRKGVTQVELAKLARVDQSTISGWELGNCRPSISAFHRVVEALQPPDAEVVAELHFHGSNRRPQNRRPQLCSGDS